MFRSVYGAAALLCLGLTAPAGAQMPGAAKVATVSAVGPGTVARGGHGVLTITVSVVPQFHINAHKTNDPSLIATNFLGSAPAGVVYGAAHFPAPHTIKLAGKPTPVYTGRTTIRVPFTVAKTAKPGRLALGGSLMYQGCNDSMCYPPTTVPVKASVTVK